MSTKIRTLLDKFESSSDSHKVPYEKTESLFSPLKLTAEFSSNQKHTYNAIRELLENAKVKYESKSEGANAIINEVDIPLWSQLNSDESVKLITEAGSTMEFIITGLKKILTSANPDDFKVLQDLIKSGKINGIIDNPYDKDGKLSPTKRMTNFNKYFITD